MSDDGRWLRAALTVDPVPPPDLADWAERTARRMVRRRIAAGALAAAALAVVPFALTRGGPGQRAATPSPSASPSAGPAPCPGRSSVPFVRARSAADVAWPYRGDADLLATAVAAGRGLTDVRPLFGAHLAGGRLIVAVAGREKSGWRLRWSEGNGGGAGLSLPALGPDTELSLLLQPGPPVDGIAGTLIVLAAPGTTEIAFVSCPADGTSRYSASGDTAMMPLKPRDLEGTIEIRTPTGVLALGSWDASSGGAGAYPIRPLPVPVGYREVPGVIGSAETVDYRGSVTLEDARVLVRCRAPAGTVVRTAVGSPPAAARCDGQVHVAADGLTLRPGTRLLDLSPTAFVDVLVAVPDR
jgi:hypothetical protein